jgi:hypothetical protein
MMNKMAFEIGKYFGKQAVVKLPRSPETDRIVMTAPPHMTRNTAIAGGGLGAILGGLAGAGGSGVYDAVTGGEELSLREALFNALRRGATGAGMGALSGAGIGAAAGNAATESVNEYRANMPKVVPL